MRDIQPPQRRKDGPPRGQVGLQEHQLRCVKGVLHQEAGKEVGTGQEEGARGSQQRLEMREEVEGRGEGWRECAQHVLRR